MTDAAARSEALIRAREARGLYWSIVARLCFVALFTALVVGQLLGILRPGVAAQTDTDAWATLAVQLVAAAFMSYFLSQVRREKRLLLSGVGAAVLDVALVSLLPVIWSHTIRAPDGTLSFLMKNELGVICIVFIVINALALRPLYPAIAAGGFILLHAVLALIVLSDERVVLSPSYMEHFYSSAVNPGITVVRVIILAVVGGFLAFLAASTRRTIHDAVELEIANMEIKERQAEMILSGRMAVLSDLVAGIAHEMNSPLGALRSGFDVAEKTASRLAAGKSADDLLALSRENAQVGRAAIDRIAAVVTSLKDFSRLDESETKPVDVRDGLESALALISPETLADTRIVKELAEVPAVLCRPKELNQVFMTLIVNALEAMRRQENGEGELRLTTEVEHGHVVVRIADTGPGIPEHVLDTLFELRFRPKAQRMAMGLGLPTAKRIVERQKGELTVESTLGEGSTFTVRLPLTFAS